MMWLRTRSGKLLAHAPLLCSRGFPYLDEISTNIWIQIRFSCLAGQVTVLMMEQKARAKEVTLRESQSGHFARQK
jgi:hypothetical protein